MAIVGKMATHPKVARAKKVLKKEIPIPIVQIHKMGEIPTPIMRVEIPPIPIQMAQQPIQTRTKRAKKAMKREILPKRVIPMVNHHQQIAIPMAQIRAIPPSKAILMVERGMKEMGTVLASLPKTKMHSNNALKKPKMVEITPKKHSNKPMQKKQKRHRTKQDGRQMKRMILWMHTKWKTKETTHWITKRCKKRWIMPMKRKSLLN